MMWRQKTKSLRNFRKGAKTSIPRIRNCGFPPSFSRTLSLCGIQMNLTEYLQSCVRSIARQCIFGLRLRSFQLHFSIESR